MDQIHTTLQYPQSNVPCPYGCANIMIELRKIRSLPVLGEEQIAHPASGSYRAPSISQQPFNATQHRCHLEYQDLITHFGRAAPQDPRYPPI